MPRSLLTALLLLLCLGASPAAADAVEDGIITDRVRQRLYSDPEVKGYTVEVETKDRVVTLSGTVETDRAKQRAEKLTKKTKGVKEVVNKLRVGRPLTAGAGCQVPGVRV